MQLRHQLANRLRPRLHQRVHVAPKRCSTTQRRAAGIRTASSSSTKVETAFDIKDKIQFLKDDLQHLFDEQGIDAGAYEEVVDFLDPITKYTSLGGYLFNIAFLKKAFNPQFHLHDIWASTDTAVTTRWTMVMEFSLTKGLPIIGKVFQPTLIFTGTSTYVFNPASGKIFRHIDTWDSISNQEFFSFEGFGDFLGQVFQPYSTPPLETPEYLVLKRTKGYQIRRYQPFLVAECRERNDGAVEPSASTSTSPAQPTPSSPGVRAFQALAGYIFGKNQAGQVMKMTTPVYSDSRGLMQFVIAPSSHQSLSTVPAPVSPLVSTAETPARICAVKVFNGAASPESAEQELRVLQQCLARDGLRAAGPEWSLARYNHPGTPGVFRRNEVLVPLDEDSLWASWR